MRYISNRENQVKEASPDNLINMPISTDLRLIWISHADPAQILLDAVIKEFSFGIRRFAPACFTLTA